MTLLHQAAQKAVEALNAVRGDKSFCCLKEERTQAVVLAAIAQLSAALQQQPEPVAQIDESKLPPRPAGHNGPDTDPDSPLVRYGRAKPESGVLLEPMDDGYWTPWHIANEMLRATLQHQEVPREPVAMIEAEDALSLADDLEAIRRKHWMHWTAQENHIAATSVRHLRLLAASPSTTRQQEVGSAPEGFRLLPVEATDAMMYADWDVTMSDAHSNGGVSAAAWRAMVEAAPQVTYGNGHSGVGWYMHDTDYPEEGAVFLGAAAPSTPEKAGGVPACIAASPAPSDDWSVARDCAVCGRMATPGGPCQRAHGVSASVPHPLPAQANDGGEHG